MKIQNTLVSNILDRSQRYFAHVTTVTLSWRVQNIVVIGRIYFTLECFEFSWNFEFDQNMLSGAGAWPCHALSCFVFFLPGFDLGTFRQIYKRWDSYGGLFQCRYLLDLQSDKSRLITIWVKCRYFLIFWAKTLFYVQYLLIAWYLVYSVVLVKR